MTSPTKLPFCFLPKSRPSLFSRKLGSSPKNSGINCVRGETLSGRNSVCEGLCVCVYRHIRTNQIHFLFDCWATGDTRSAEAVAALWRLSVKLTTVELSYLFKVSRSLQTVFPGVTYAGRQRKPVNQFEKKTCFSSDGEQFWNIRTFIFWFASFAAFSSLGDVKNRIPNTAVPIKHAIWVIVTSILKTQHVFRSCKT